jgi:hypothetical protein
MAMEIVNGYPCKNCTDVEFAKKGVDPARPKEAEKAKEATPSERAPAVTFGGQVQAPEQANGVEAVPPSQYVPGSSISLRA